MMHAHHVITVHDHEYVLSRHVFRAAHCGVDLVQQHMVEICALTIQLLWLLNTVSYIEYITVPCKELFQ
jgi:hypothetical protein